MKSVGIFEAKTKLSEICEHVATRGEAVVITRRGKPLVRIAPVEDAKETVWQKREEVISELGDSKDDLLLLPRSRELPSFDIKDEEQ